MQDADGTLRTAPGSLGERDGQHDHSVSIELDFDPELAVKRTVGTTDGDIETRSVWLNLRDELSEYTPERVNGSRASAGRLTRRSPASSPKSTARRSSTGRGQRLVPQRRWGEPFDPTARLVTLTGNLGRQGTGLDHYVGQEKIWTFNGWKNPRSRPEASGRPDDALDVLPRRGSWRTPTRTRRRRFGSRSKGGWMPLYPSERDDSGRPDPESCSSGAGTTSIRPRGTSREEELWPKLDLVVDINFRMDSTALNSDIVLPTASHYETTSRRRTCTPTCTRSRRRSSRWASRRPTGRSSAIRREDTGTGRGPRYGPVDDRKFDRQIDQSVTTTTSATGSTTSPVRCPRTRRPRSSSSRTPRRRTPRGPTSRSRFDEIDEQPKRLLETGDHWSSDIEEGEAYTPWKDYVQDKNPWPTFTGRQQYYIDHDWFLELDEQLPTHKEAPVLQEKSEYPLGYNTPHSRWSIHSTWRDSSKMLRLQRGEPTVYLNPTTTPRSGDRGRRHRAGVQRPRLGRGAGEDLPERGARHRPALLQLGAVPVPRPQQLQFARPDVHEADAARPVPRGHGRAPPLLPELLGSDRREQRRSDRGREGRRGGSVARRRFARRVGDGVGVARFGLEIARGALGRVSDLLGGDD